VEVANVYVSLETYLPHKRANKGIHFWEMTSNTCSQQSAAPKRHCVAARQPLRLAADIGSSADLANRQRAQAG